MSSPFWQFDTDLNPNRLAAKFVDLHQFETEFAMLTGEHYHKYWGYAHHTAKDSETPDVDGGAMINEYVSELKNGGTDILIPVIKPPTDMPVFGDTPVTNLGTTSDVVYQRAEVNQISYPHVVVSGMQYQIIGDALAKKLNDSANALRYRFTKFTDKDLYHTMANGLSMSLTGMSGIEGARTTLTPHSHGNFYVPNAGMIGYTNGRPGSSGYEGDLVAALNNLNTGDSFDTRLIEELEYQADERRIPAFQTKFGDFRVLLVHTAAYRQLLEDSRFEAAKREASSGQGWNGLEFRNFRGQWSNTLVFTTPRMPGVQLTNNTYGQVATRTAYNGMPAYGPTDWYTNLDARDTSKIKLGIMCGPNMITKAYGHMPVTFEGEVRVGEQRQIMILRAIHAYVLSDIWDLDGKISGLSAGDYYENVSSMLFATASPSN